MSQQKPLSTSDILFPSAHTSISDTLTGLKRSQLSVRNRLRSIKCDADFVQGVAQAYRLPLLANERCGSWYIFPDQKAGSAYFKSTDGHHGQWSFSLRRLNLQVLDIIGENEGCIIIDSTRRGKSMPDALSKTVPIWICVLNRLLFPDQQDFHALLTPEDVISQSEHAQIQARLDSFVGDVISKLALDLQPLRARLRGRPMVPEWVTPESTLSSPRPESDTVNRVILCTASSRVSSVAELGTDYVQGAADDSESWAHGLTPSLFWSNVDTLLATPDDELPTAIADTKTMSDSATFRIPSLIKPTTNLWIGDNDSSKAAWSSYDIVLSCSKEPENLLLTNMKDRYCHLACGTGKIGSRDLRSQLPKLDDLPPKLSSSSKILVTCPTGRDLAVAVALALLILFYRDDGAQDRLAAQNHRSKDLIKQRLSWIMISMSDASPSRASLQSVNAYLLG